MFILIQSFNQATSILIRWLKRFRKLTRTFDKNNETMKINKMNNINSKENFDRSQIRKLGMCPAIIHGIHLPLMTGVWNAM